MMAAIVPSVTDVRTERYIANLTAGSIQRWHAPEWPTPALLGAGPPLTRKGAPGDVFELIEVVVSTCEYRGLQWETREAAVADVIEIPGELFANIG
jgi:hypothetical protein